MPFFFILKGLSNEHNFFLCHVHFFKPGLAEIFQGLMRILSMMLILFLYTVPEIYHNLNRKVFFIIK